MADTPRLRALQNLSNNLPVANSQIAAGHQAAQQMQIQNAVRSAPAGTGTNAAQQTGASAAQQKGSEMIDSAGTQLQQQSGKAGLAAVGAAETANTNAAQIGSLQAGAKDSAQDNVARLDAVASGAKADLYDKQMQFAKDQDNRTLFSEQQLSDYAVANAQSAQEYQNKAQAASIVNQRNIQMLETAHAKIMEDLNFKYQQAKQAGDHNAQESIRSMMNETEDRMSREKARAANSSAAWQAGGLILGGAAGAAIGQSASGAAGGAGVGSALGSAASGIGL